MKKALMLVAFAVFVGHPGGIAAQSASLAGMWDATVTVNGIEIPFRMEFSGAGSAVKRFIKGDRRAGGRTNWPNGIVGLTEAPVTVLSKRSRIPSITFVFPNRIVGRNGPNDLSIRRNRNGLQFSPVMNNRVPCLKSFALTQAPISHNGRKKASSAC